MNKFIKIIQYIFSFITGYFLIPSLYLGFILATNSSKGWNVQNDDGILFIPIGIIILIISILIISVHIIFLASFKNNKKHKIILGGLYLLGIILYLIIWIFG